jgi:hypothetical protein
VRRSTLVLGSALAAAVLSAGAAAAASLGVTSARLTVFRAPGPVVIGDTRAPQLVLLEMSETGIPDGFVDRVVATFDEPLAASTAGTAGWTLAASPSGRAVTAVTVVAGGTTAVLSLGGGTTTKDTAGTGFTVALAATAGGIRDAAGNLSSFAATPVADKAGPVPTRLVIENGPSPSDGNGGEAGQGDRVRVTFSEKLAVASLCSTWAGDGTAQSITASNVVTVTIKNHASAPVTTNDRLTVSTSAAACAGAFRFGTVDLGSPGFVTANVTLGGASPNQSTIAWSPTAAELVVTLGAASAGTADENASSTVATYTPAAGIQDLAGNAAAGSVASVGRQF